MALLYMCTVTSTGSVVVMDQVRGLVWPSSTCQTLARSAPETQFPCEDVFKGTDNHTDCNSVFHSTYGMTNSRACGRIIGYQKATTDGLQELIIHGYLLINSMLMAFP